MALENKNSKTNVLIACGVGLLLAGVIAMQLVSISNTKEAIRANKHLSERISKIENQLDKMADYEILSADIKRKLVEDFRTTASKSFDNAVEKMAQAQSERLDQHREYSEDAYRRGKQALADKQLDLAQIYFLSAVNHSPNNFSYLREYAGIVLANASGNAQELSKLNSIVQLSLYQIDPKHVKETLSLMEQISKQQSTLYERSLTKEAAQPERNWTSELTQLSASPPSNLETAKLKVENLQSLLVDLTSAGMEDTKIAQQAKSELGKTVETVQALSNCKYVDSCLEKLAETDLSSDKAVSLVQAAQNILPQFWGVDFGLLPKSTVDKINDYPKRIEDAVGKIARKRSLPYLEKIAKAKKAALEYSDGNCQSRIEHITKELQNTQICLMSIKSADIQDDAQREIMEMSKRISQLRQEQIKKYNHRAITMCSDAWKRWQDTGVSTNDAEAWDVFNKSRIAKLDQRLLNPEINALLNRIIQAILSEFNAKDKVKMEKILAETTKYKMEDF